MAESRIDGRVDYYRPDINPFAETQKNTILEGFKVGGVGPDLRIGQKLRAWVIPEGKYPEKHPLAQDILGFDMVIKARVYGHGKMPELVMEDADRTKKQVVIVPESAIERGHFEYLEFGTAPVKARELKFGQVIEGINLRGDRATFIVGTPHPDTKLPALETISDQPKRIPLNVKDDGNLLLADQYRLLGETVTDLVTWVSKAAQKGIDPAPFLRLNLKDS